MNDDIVDALAVHRLTKLVIDDYITEPLRNKLFEHHDPSESKLGYFATCPWCVSFWVGVGVVTARTIAPKAWRPLSYALAFSSVTGWVEEHS